MTIDPEEKETVSDDAVVDYDESNETLNQLLTCELHVPFESSCFEYD